MKSGPPQTEAAVDEIMKPTPPEALAAYAGDGAPTASPLDELSPTQTRAVPTDNRAGVVMIRLAAALHMLRDMSVGTAPLPGTREAALLLDQKDGVLVLAQTVTDERHRVPGRRWTRRGRRSTEELRA